MGRRRCGRNRSANGVDGGFGWLNDAIFVSRIETAGVKDQGARRISDWQIG